MAHILLCSTDEMQEHKKEKEKAQRRAEGKLATALVPFQLAELRRHSFFPSQISLLGLNIDLLGGFDIMKLVDSCAAGVGDRRTQHTF